jgi:hypothetical protein
VDTFLSVRDCPKLKPPGIVDVVDLASDSELNAIPVVAIVDVVTDNFASLSDFPKFTALVE